MEKQKPLRETPASRGGLRHSPKAHWDRHNGVGAWKKKTKNSRESCLDNEPGTQYLPTSICNV